MKHHPNTLFKDLGFEGKARILDVGKNHNSVRSEVTNSNAHRGQAGMRMSDLALLGTIWVK